MKKTKLQVELDSHRACLVDEIPKCDFCTAALLPGRSGRIPAYYDAATKGGPWAFMCETHFALHGIGLGNGVGQRLVLRPLKAEPAAPSMTIGAVMAFKAAERKRRA